MRIYVDGRGFGLIADFGNKIRGEKVSKLKSIFIEVISRPAESVERTTLKRHSEVSDESRFWALSQVFFLGYHAAPRSPRKRTPAGAGVL